MGTVKILLIHGPNLNALGKRSREIYGNKSLEEINGLLQQHAGELGANLTPFQSNSEGDIIDFLQKESGSANGIVINPGALTHYGYSLRDALVDTGLPVVEVHISNIHAREGFRRESVVAPVAIGQICGLGWRSYAAAVRFLVSSEKQDVY